MESDTKISLSPRAAFYFMIRTLALWVFLGLWGALFFGGGSSNQAYTPNPGIQWSLLGGIGVKFFLIFVILLTLNWIYCRIKVGTYEIELKDKGVSLNYGIINKNYELLLYDKVQDITIDRSLVERLLGTATLTIQNAMGRPQIIPALDFATAQSFRDKVLERTSHSHF